MKDYIKTNHIPNDECHNSDGDKVHHNGLAYEHVHRQIYEKLY